ncbi:MAG: helix-turn-helix transcriptional regulator [Actinomycetota bacterium]|nr:helix-turn-helix transcriptional regulator [Actinomycetota bacterium]
MNERTEAVYIISVAAELVGMHPQTLRGYEHKGLVEPFRTPGGTRRYSLADVERLLLIQELSNAGVNLEGIRRILALQNEITRLSSQVARLRRLLEDAERRRSPSVNRRVVRFGVTRPSLPDVRRDDPFGVDQ